MGPIGAVLIPQFLGEKEGQYSPFLSSLCGACYDICPVKIDLPNHLLTLRNRVVESGNVKLLDRSAFKIWSFIASRPKLYSFMSAIPAKLQRLMPKNKSFPVPGYRKEREFARFSPKGFKKLFHEMNINKNEQQNSNTK